ncbi:MAG: aminopeptidase P family protein [Burkholderiales bacterium]|nr:aminopeptidase P family protein [Burkholderiales bacterium]
MAEHRKAQQAAKTVLARLPCMITPEDTEHSIACKAREMLCAAGYAETWYYQCQALVLLGSRSCISVSGKDYQANHEKVGHANLITIDLSPTLGNYWGDCARSFVMEDGKVTATPQALEFKNGLHFLDRLHQEILKLLKPQTSFGQLFEWANVRIRESGFVNLDYRGNVGHSIAGSREERQFIEADNPVRLGDVPFFSFEPFVRLKGGKWGFKHEDIFFFDQTGALQLL